MKGRKHFTEKGVALIAVAGSIAVVAALTADFSYGTNADYAAACNARDEMRAHYLGVSGMNLSRLVIKVQKDVFDKYRKYLGDVQLADYLPLLVGAFGGGKDEVDSLAGVLGIDTAATPIKGLGLPEGEFDVVVTTDDGKINVNCANGAPNTQKQLELMLSALIAPTAFDPLFEQRDGDGQFTDRPTFAHAIIDYVDRDEAAFGQTGQIEDYGYATRPEGYRAKNNYLDSVDELQLARGMDDRKWQLFAPAFTVYGGCKVNLSAANDINVIAAVIYQAAKDPNDPVLRDMVKLYALAGRVAQARLLGIMFDTAQSFADYVKDPDGALTGLLTGDGTGTAGGAPIPTPTGAVGLPPGVAPLTGVELDNAKLAQIARVGGRRTYRVNATARIGRVEKKIVGLWDTDTTNQNARDPAYARGNWVYWREE